MCDENCFIGKNLAIIYKNAAYVNYEKVRVVTIVPDSGITLSTFLIRLVLSIVHEGILLYDSGNITVILSTDIELYRLIQNTNREKQKSFQYLAELSCTYNKFIIYRNQFSQLCILPGNLYFSFVFKHVEKLIKSSRNVHVSMKYLEETFTTLPNTNRQVSLVDLRRKTKEAGKKVIVPVDTLLVEPLSSTDYLNLPISQPTDAEPEWGQEKHDTTGEEDRQDAGHVGIYNCEQTRFSSPTREQHTPHSHTSVQQDNLSFDSYQTVPSSYNVTQQTGQISTNRLRGLNQDSHPLRARQSLPTNNVIVTSHSVSRSNEPVRRANETSAPVHPPRYPDYVELNRRFESFGNWPHRSPNPTRLVESGFFFTNETDLVRCFQCGIGLKDFSEDDDPLQEHVRHSDRCPFLPKLLGENILNQIKAQLQASDAEYNRQSQRHGEQAIFASTQIRHPQFQTLQARLDTFITWPNTGRQTPLQLAEAGLYYTGTEDLVRCFACDGGLRRWDPEDDPWTEHCRWFPACSYCIEQKGEEYIALVQASVDQQELGAGGGDMVNDMEQLRITQTEVQSLYNANKYIFSDMGFKEVEVIEALKELYNRGNKKPEIEDVIDLITVIKERYESEQSFQEKVKQETPLETNQRLKRILLCNQCKKNAVNALFLPCTHHILCMGCAESFNACPRCNRPIREKIKTFMG